MFDVNAAAVAAFVWCWCFSQFFLLFVVVDVVVVSVVLFQSGPNDDSQCGWRFYRV